MDRPLVLFVCTHNSARSQMAEGLLRARYGDRYRAASAGTSPGRVHPLAVEAMREVGVDLASHHAKAVDAFPDGADVVVTVCDGAREACPYVPARDRNVHHGFPDPSAAEGTDAERLAAFRTVRDSIAVWIDAAFGPVEPATPDDLRPVLTLLKAARLPRADLAGSALDHFHVVRGTAGLLGVVGLEVYGGRWGLLRSLAVAEGARGSGLGGRLVAAVEADAARLGLDGLYLLTTTAAPFFAARGWTGVDRDAVPEPVRTSTEFRGLCPASAVCLTKAPGRA
ncbi:MAG TPA: arsenic resistance N-acetyltransferase ArsN2 [Rhodothermales bacterium]|nr:arsenic resistance N-acetyltransferase ArsN2 [Rhodothermales bacterium]